MIYGVGTDICDVRRIRASIARHGERFALKILSDAEFATWQARSARWPIKTPHWRGPPADRLQTQGTR